MTSERPYFLAYIEQLIGTEKVMRQLNPMLAESSFIRERTLTELKGLVEEGKHMLTQPTLSKQVRIEVLSSTPNVPVRKPREPVPEPFRNEAGQVVEDDDCGNVD